MQGLRKKIYEIIFEADTPAGKLFDVALLLTIAASVIVVMLESVDSLNQQYGEVLASLEWTFTLLFTLEYLLRIWVVKNPVRYAKSFFGIIDLLAILPSYLRLLLPGTQYLMVIRALRVLRVFRILKLGHFLREGDAIIDALKSSRAKIIVFMVFIVLMVTIIGAVMYLIESPTNPGFSNIPVSIYWAIVTLTTVGYGDISPATDLGRMLAAVVMLLGYAVLAVPTGIVSAELVARKNIGKISTQVCPHCMREGHEAEAVYCKFCGGALNA